ncbi:MAG: 50S ribosomal protein L23 [Chlamydiales bacterium]|nr:50S ribosomal protein L23 [Chlamydiales bacterium]MCH9635770.1 50S ribosomal protein L23 [Chlamydiales bacterium]MCH9704318.1 50S ribosomal protein L23 [Chlamydiota bacterium]
MSDPYKVVKARYITEKATMLEQLQNAENNPSLARCKSPKYVFVVDKAANKEQIRLAVEEIYKEKSVKVAAVNTIVMKAKATKRGRRRGRPGKKASFKKAIVTMEPGDTLDNV